MFVTGRFEFSDVMDDYWIEDNKKSKLLVTWKYSKQKEHAT